MPKVPLQNISLWGHKKTVQEATHAVSKWPAWKRERRLFSEEVQGDNSEPVREQGNAELDSTVCSSLQAPRSARKSRSAAIRAAEF